MKFALLSLVLLTSTASAVIVDGVAISIGNRVITRSEIDQRISLTAFLNGVQPERNPAARREAAQRLIDQKLVEREMDLGRYPHGDAGAVGRQLMAYTKANFDGSESALAARAAGYGLTPPEIGADLARQADFLSFLNLRFRPAVQVSDEDIRKYFDQKFAPRLPPEQSESALVELRGQIEEQLTTEAADRELEIWLKDQRQRTRIQYVDNDLK